MTRIPLDLGPPLPQTGSPAMNGKDTARLADLLGFILLLLMCCVLAAPSGAQDDMKELNTRFVPIYTTSPGTGLLVINVFAEKSLVRMDRQALLKLVNLNTQVATWQTTDAASEGMFNEIPYGDYDIEASAVGYIPQHTRAHVVQSDRANFEIVLHRDPAAIKLDVADRVMLPKARKETKNAVTALKSNRFADAQKHLDAAFRLDPASAELNFLLGYLYLQTKDFEKASKYLSTAATLSPHDPQVLTLLGRANLERKDYPAAQTALESAVIADPESWLPHDLLADACLHQKNYPEARDQSQLALAKGAKAANPARLVLGEALINLGQDEQGVQALEAFLQEAPTHPLAGQLHDLITNVRQRAAASASGTPEESPTPQVGGVDPLMALSAPDLAVKTWQPMGVDDIKVALVPGYSCPTGQVVFETGKHVAELVDDLMRFAAVEDLLHQSLDVFGNPTRTETRKYNYVASISQPKQGELAVEEFRDNKLGLDGYPDHIASTGFAVLAFVFHPANRDSFDLNCEGLGEWNGRAIWLVHFKQRDDRPNRMHAYQVGNVSYPVGLKGRAWITADTFQILRIESEMVRPMPQIKLLSEHQVVEYGPVRFEKKKTSLWLPKSAEIYFDFRQHRYYRRHSFDHYMLFSTDAEEKRKEPVAPPAKPS